jgi:hypothetical protein
MASRLAQLNIGRVLHPLDHPQMKEFMDGLALINGTADHSPGFVWRLQTDEGDATGVQHPWSEDPFMFVNMSVWETVEDLQQFVFRTGHLQYLRKRAEWFEKMDQAHYVLWWVPAGHIPTLEEASERLEHYRAHGATPHAFWFGKLFPAPEVSAVPV